MHGPMYKIKFIKGSEEMISYVWTLNEALEAAKNAYKKKYATVVKIKQLRGVK